MMLHDIERIIKKNLGSQPESIRTIENVTNNTVYSFEVTGKRYILKFYRNRYWPEDGKIPFVSRTLAEHKIPAAVLVTFQRMDEAYPDGYLIEEELPGCAADKMPLDREKEIELYGKLADLVSSVHCIPVRNFGYIGDGEGDSESMASFFEDEFEDRTDILTERNIFTEAELRNIKEVLLKVLRDFDDLPSVLCHGDLSKKNVMVQEDGEIVLIDWDDAMAYNWMADISRFTFWLKLNYDEQDAVMFRNTFLEHYQTDFRKSEFECFEKVFHLYIALDYLAYFIRTGETSMEYKMKNWIKDMMAKI